MASLVVGFTPGRGVGCRPHASFLAPTNSLQPVTPRLWACRCSAYDKVIAIAKAAGVADDRWVQAMKSILWAIPNANYNCLRCVPYPKARRLRRRFLAADRSPVDVMA